MPSIVLSALVVLAAQASDAARLIEQLSCEELESRDQAAQQLKTTSEKSVLAALRTASTRNDEVGVRCREILKWREWSAIVPAYLRKHRLGIVDELASSVSRLDYVRRGDVLPPAAVAKALLDPNPEVVRSGLLALVDRSPRRSEVEALLSLAKSWERHSCNEAHRQRHEEFVELVQNALSRCADGRDVPTLRELLTSQSGEVRLVACAALLALAEAPGSALPELLASSDWVRLRALSLIADYRVSGMTGHLAELLSCKDKQVRHRAALALQRVGDATAVPALVTQLVPDPAPESSIIRALLVLAPKGSAAVLAEWVVQHPQLTPAVAEGLIRARGEEAIPELLRHISSSTAKVWTQDWWSVEGLPRLQDASVIAQLIEVSATDEQTRRFAARCLTFADVVVVHRVCREYLGRDAPAAVQRAAASCLSQLSSDEDRAALLKWANKVMESTALQSEFLLDVAPILAGSADVKPNREIVDRILRAQCNYDLLPAFAGSDDLDRLKATLDSRPVRESSLLQRSVYRAIWRRCGTDGRRFLQQELGQADTRRSALAALAEEAPEEAVRVLEMHFQEEVSTISDYEIDVYAGPEIALATRRSNDHDRIRRALIKLWDAGVSDEARLAIVNALASRTEWLATEKVRPLLLGACKHETPSGRAALLTLASTGDKEAINILAASHRSHYETLLQKPDDYLLSTDPRVRESALEAMHALRRCTHTDNVRELAALDEPIVRRSAVRALRVLQDKTLVPFLRHILHDAGSDVLLGREAAAALHELGDVKWREDVESLLSVQRMDWRAIMILDYVANERRHTIRDTALSTYELQAKPVEAMQYWLSVKLNVSPTAELTLKRTNFDQWSASYSLAEFVARCNAQMEPSAQEPLVCYWSGEGWTVCMRREAAISK